MFRVVGYWQLHGLGGCVHCNKNTSYDLALSPAEPGWKIHSLSGLMSAKYIGPFPRGNCVGNSYIRRLMHDMCYSRKADLPGLA